jgi:4-amino-4-deoxy-L-arabinose transferase-like glycosyltransferase
MAFSHGPARSDVGSDRVDRSQSKWTIESLFAPGQWLLRQFSNLDASRIPAAAWIMATWALMALPAFFLRSAHYEEGTVIALARGAFEDGHWLTPFRYGVRFVERPVLLSWIIAGIGELAGTVNLYVARLPHLLFLLAGGFVVFDLVRTNASKSAALFGALCWFACPMIAQKFITAEPDVTVSVLLFTAFWLWWKNSAADKPSIRQWLLIGLVLGLAGLTKGPQPIAYFTIGVGLYLAIKKQWASAPGFIIANVVAASLVGAWYVAVASNGDASGWLIHSRLSTDVPLTRIWRDHLDFVVSLFFEWLPCSLLLGPAIFIAVRPETAKNDLLLASLLYALGCTLVLLFWPGGVATRYAMPATPALAVMAGLMFERLRHHRPKLVAGALVVAQSIALYVIVLGGIVMPLAPKLFQRSSLAAETINQINKDIRGPIFALSADLDYNILAHVTARISITDSAALEEITAPALSLLKPPEVSILTRANPGLKISQRAEIDPAHGISLYEITPLTTQK